MTEEKKFKQHDLFLECQKYIHTYISSMQFETTAEMKSERKNPFCILVK